MDETTISRLTGMTLTQAGSVTWHTKGLNIPIGEAVATHQIAAGDLGYAAENGYTPQLRSAALTILLHRLVGQQLEIPTPPTVVTGSRYSEWKERRATVLIGVLIGGMVGILLSIFALGILGIIVGIRGILPPLTLLMLIMIPIFGVVISRANTLVDELENYRNGRWGEEKIIEQLRIYLDGAWTVYHSFEWPGGEGGDIDLILVGSKGVWALEVKAYSGLIVNEYDTWTRKGSFNGLPSHPGKQARGNAKRLQRLLDSKGVKIRYVEPVVAWAKSEQDPLEEKGSLIVNSPDTPVWKLDHFEKGIEQLQKRKDSLTGNEIKDINKILKGCIDDAKRLHSDHSKETSAHA